MTSRMKIFVAVDGFLRRARNCFLVVTLGREGGLKRSLSGQVNRWRIPPIWHRSHLGQILFLYWVPTHFCVSLGRLWPPILILAMARWMSVRGPLKYSSRPTEFFTFRYHFSVDPHLPFLFGFHKWTYHFSGCSLQSHLYN